jgi:type II secretory pathway pseudopilin PulG
MSAKWCLMKKHFLKRKIHKGYTIPETLVSILLFSILLTMWGSAVILGHNHFRKGEAETLAQRTYRNIIEPMSTDFRQAIPNPTSRGYRSINKEAEPTAILRPNQYTKSSNEIILSLPNFTTYKIADKGFDEYNTAIYRRIRYYAEQNTIFREVITYKSDGTIGNRSSTPVAQVESGTITISARYNSLKSCTVDIKVVEYKNQKHQRTYSDSITFTSFN